MTTIHKICACTMGVLLSTPVVPDAHEVWAGTAMPTDGVQRDQAERDTCPPRMRRNHQLFLEEGTLKGVQLRRRDPLCRLSNWRTVKQRYDGERRHGPPWR